jgi:hypothetical protein
MKESYVKGVANHPGLKSVRARVMDFIYEPPTVLVNRNGDLTHLWSEEQSPPHWPDAIELAGRLGIPFDGTGDS